MKEHLLPAWISLFLAAVYGSQALLAYFVVGVLCALATMGAAAYLSKEHLSLGEQLVVIFFWPAVIVRLAVRSVERS